MSEVSAEGKTFPLRITTRDVESREVINVRVIDHGVHSDRVWLGKHCFWAARNGYEVTSTPMEIANG